MISKTAIDRLDTQLNGYILQPGNSTYEAATKIDNGRIQLQPRLIIRPTHVDDVALSMKFAIDNDVPFTVKGGGHSAAGYCMNAGGVVLEMKHLNAISLGKGKETVKVQMGAIWRDVYVFMAGTGTGRIPIGGGRQPSAESFPAPAATVKAGLRGLVVALSPVLLLLYGSLRYRHRRRPVVD